MPIMLVNKEIKNKQIESSICLWMLEMDISEENNVFLPEDALCDAKNILSSLV